MTVSHKDLPDAQLHEPKGVSGASINTVYLADGAGSGDWVPAPFTYTVTAEITDIGTASSAYVVCPVAGTITRIDAVIHAATTAGDDTLTTYIGATTITNGTITVVTSGSAAGSSFSATPTANNVTSAGSVLRVATDGASGTTVRCTVTFTIQVGYQ